MANMVEMKTVKMKLLDGEEVIFEIVDEQARNKTTILEDILEDILNDNSIQIEKIWQNASTSSAFAEQEISNISTDNTTFIMGVFNMSITNTRKYVFFAPIGYYGEALRIGNVDSSSALAYYQRRFALTSAGKLMFSNTYLKQTSNSTNNEYLIPVVIYAVKGVQ